MKISLGSQKYNLITTKHKDDHSSKGVRRISTIDKPNATVGLKAKYNKSKDKKNIIYRTLEKTIAGIKYLSSYKKDKHTISKTDNKKKTDECQRKMSLNETNIKTYKNKHTTFSGILSFFEAISKTKINDLCENDAPEIVLRAKTLLSLCNKPGDVVVLTFSGSGGTHSGILAYDESLSKPVYLSFGKMISFNPKGGGYTAVCEDIYAFKDMVDDNNIVKIEGLDTHLMLDKWRNSIKNKSFNPLTRNCSGIARKLLILGTKNKIEKKSYVHNRVWQMPLNTHKLALEIKNEIKKT